MQEVRDRMERRVTDDLGEEDGSGYAYGDDDAADDDPVNQVRCQILDRGN